MQSLRLVAIWVVLVTFVIVIPSAMAAGSMPICNQTKVMDAGLCYQPCITGYKGIGPQCWKACPSGYRDDGATCCRVAHIMKRDSYGRGVGKVKKIEGGEKQGGLWYKACKTGYKGVGPVCWKICPADYKTDGATCRIDAHVVLKKKYWRGAGTVPKSCPTGQKYKAGLCY